MSYSKISSYCDDALSHIRDVIEEMHEAKMPMTHISKFEDCKDILRTIDSHASDMDDEIDELNDRLEYVADESQPEGEDVSFTAMGEITAYASNFKDVELMESLAKCFERNIAPQKIIDLLDSL